MSFPTSHLTQLQRHVAIVAVGPTDLRRMRGTKGKRGLMQDVLAKTSLPDWKPINFEASLEDLTQKLCRIFDGNFGAARKAGNLFLRDCVNHYALRSHYRLAEIEALLEVPLDSISMAAIRKESQSSAQAVWVSNLTHAMSDTYQDDAQSIANRKGIDRVHLDVLWRAEGRK